MCSGNVALSQFFRDAVYVQLQLYTAMTDLRHFRQRLHSLSSDTKLNCRGSAQSRWAWLIFPLIMKIIVRPAQ